MKYKVIISLFVGVISLQSCNLDETPYGFYSEDNFFKSEAEAEAGLLYAYGALNYIEYSRNIFFLGDTPSEATTVKSDVKADYKNLDQWNVADFNTNIALENYFKYAFIGINRANAVIKNLPGINMNEEARNKILGEAYFLRAWNYFNLVRNFGLIPLHSTVVETLSQTTQPLAKDMDEVYNLIFSDCRQASDLLSVNSTPKLGRADKVAAQALAAKAYLYVASAKEHNVKLYRDMERESTVMYDSAAYFANKVLTDQQTYGFEENLLDIYDIEKSPGKEHIFMMSMDRTGTSEGDFSKISMMFTPNFSGASIWLRQGDTSELVKTRSGFEEYRTTEKFYKAFDNEDLRKKHLIVTQVFAEDGSLYAEYPNGFSFPFSRKYIDPLFIGEKSSSRPYLIRYSDIALVYAEAKGPTTEGYAIANFIRERAGLSDLPENLTLEKFREAILEERRFELAFEADRMYDLRRWNKILEVVEEAKDAQLTEDEVAFYPIPQAEINLNGSLRQ